MNFAAGRQFACQHYSLRVNGSTDFPTAWELQGRASDDASWSCLHSVDNMCTSTDVATGAVPAAAPAFTRAGQCVSWPVAQRGSVPQFCSDLRVLLRSATAAGSNVLNVCHVEFYGHLQ